MKKIIFFSITLFILMCSEYAISGPCDYEGQNCGDWIDSDYPYIFIHPSWPNCNIEVHYRYKICDGITYTDLVMVAFDYDPDNPDDPCKGVLNWLLPNGVGSTVDQTALGMLWTSSMTALTQQWFIIQHLQNPNAYICPDYYTYKSIMGGGCASWRHAYYPNASYPTVVHIRPVPCEENGCCVKEWKWCWDNQTQQPQYDFSATRVISQYPDCNGLSPLYNPFARYPQGWEIGPSGPCEPSCWIQ